MKVDTVIYGALFSLPSRNFSTEILIC